MTIGKKIKYRREALGLYQSELADKVGVNQSQISHIEKDFRKPSLDLLIKISKALKCNVDYLIDSEKSA